MNHLEQLKQKLMIKPSIQERERVAVVIKGEKQPKKTPAPTIKKKDIGKQIEEGIIDLSEEITKTENIESRIADVAENIQELQKYTEDTNRPLIVDKTDIGYDRQALLKRLTESKKTKVTIKPIVEIAEKQIEPIPQPTIKKAKKVEIKLPLIEEDESPEEVIIAPKQKVIQEKIAIEESPEEVVIMPKPTEQMAEKETIQVKLPKEKTRKTKKVEKGVAVLGPEVNILMGDTDLTKRLPKKQPPINIKVGSYIMNNREIFVNFINSLFEPYKRELDENKESISCDTIGKTS